MSKFITATGNLNVDTFINAFVSNPSDAIDSLDNDEKNNVRQSLSIRVCRALAFTIAERANASLPKAQQVSLDAVQESIGGAQSKSERGQYRAIGRLVMVHGLSDINAHNGLLGRFADSALRSGKGAAARKYVNETSPEEFTVEGLESALLVQPDKAEQTDLDKLNAALKVIGDILPMLSDEDAQYAADSLSSLAADARDLLASVVTTVAA